MSDRTPSFAGLPSMATLVPAAGSVSDQAFVSGTTFVLNIALARWLGMESYGAFAIATSVGLFVAGFHNALSLEPMTVLTARVPSELQPSDVLLNGLLQLSASLVVGAAIVVAASLWPTASPEAHVASIALASMGAALPAQLTFLTARRACYVLGRVRLAALGAPLYAGVTLLTLFLAAEGGYLGVSTGFVAMATGSVAYLVAVVPTLVRGGTSNVPPGAFTGRAASRLRENWGYGRWVVGQAIVSWTLTAAYAPLLGLTAGTAVAGELRVLQMFYMPFQQVLGGLEQFVLPRMAARYSEGRARAAGRIRRLFAGVSVVGGSAYAALAMVAAFSGLGEWLGLSPGMEWLTPMLLLGVASVLTGLLQAEYLTAKALLRPKSVFWAQAIAACVTLALGWFLVAKWGLTGASLGILLTQMVALIFMRRAQGRLAPHDA